MSEQNDFHKTPFVWSKSPLLLRTCSIPEKILCSSGALEQTKPMNQPPQPLPPVLPRSDNEIKNENSRIFHNKMFVYDSEDDYQQDMAAMSVINLYQSAENLEADLDTNRDLMDPSQHMLTQQTTLKCNSAKGDGALLNNIEVSEEPYRKESSQVSTAAKCAKPKIFFDDGVRSVDFVLVWDALEEDAVTAEAFAKRQIFETNLIKEGLELEYEPQEHNGLNFVKIHAPQEVLRRYSEILKLRMPMREELCNTPREYQRSNALKNIKRKIPALRQVSTRTNFLIEGINNQWDKIKTWIFVDKKTFPDKGHRFTAIYSRDREYLKRFSDNSQNDFSFGIERLLDDNVYVAAYPLHDGDLRIPGSTRNLLYTQWASLRKWYRYQPLDYVKEYFGVKIALYFAWLGYYTHILTPAAVVGLACFIYSCATLYDNQPSEDVCNQKIEEKMCPMCEAWCNYWDIKESCTHARIAYLFDNATTVFFAIFMSVWATLFLEMWKRYSAEITHRWDLTGFDIQEEHPRPQYLARLAHVKRKQVNIVTNTMEPHVPFWKLRVPMTIFSFSVVLLLVTLALATVVGVVLYRISILVSLKARAVNNSQAMLITTCTAACINLGFILVFNQVYTYLAEYLTEFELLRTQTEFDDSLTLKIYLLQFVNYYASIFYIAFFKGKFVGYPKEYNTILGRRQEECGTGGCLLELCIQLGIIMVGKQAMNTVLEMLFPLFFKWLNTLKLKTGLSKEQMSSKSNRPQWVKDYKLVEWGPRSLFPEYLEMVLQYGFVTIFVAAFPLAPFFALLNNILEMRLDAQKLLTFYRRPVTQRVKDIGVWYRILDSIGKLSVVTNGFIIAFTSEFIPKMVYLSQHHTLDNYLNSSLSYFNTSDFFNETRHHEWNSTEICRYPDYRELPRTPNEYQTTAMFWKILTARLAFVVIFENVVVFVMIIVKWCIPDVPEKLRDQIRREAYITNEIIIKQETIRAQNGHLYVSPKKKEKLRNINEAPSSPEQWDRLISKSLSGSEFDLLVHHEKHEDSGPSTAQTPSSI
ncbi:hypothetical protein NQ315_003434 [Exocentrus adspersus]|uniref:Anoctamin n=1 Tax=Exocentrus adspersus TaxID=1586481 RepID=A0AAV8VPA6_9CUCU|nr:hypothetical protein NQ315_003434 [Exocentrus adspersus]